MGLKSLIGLKRGSSPPALSSDSSRELLRSFGVLREAGIAFEDSENVIGQAILLDKLETGKPIEAKFTRLQAVVRRPHETSGGAKVGEMLPDAEGERLLAIHVPKWNRREFTLQGVEMAMHVVEGAADRLAPEKRALLEAIDLLRAHGARFAIDYYTSTGHHVAGHYQPEYVAASFSLPDSPCDRSGTVMLLNMAKPAVSLTVGESPHAFGSAEEFIALAGRVSALTSAADVPALPAAETLALGPGPR